MASPNARTLPYPNNLLADIGIDRQDLPRQAEQNLWEMIERFSDSKRYGCASKVRKYDVMRARYVDQKTMREIADEFGTHSGNVQQYIDYILRMVKWHKGSVIKWIDEEMKGDEDNE